MLIPFLNNKKSLNDEKESLLSSVAEVIDSGSLILGEQCKNFERELSIDLKLQDPGAAISCNSCTDALILGLKAMGVKNGDEVITVSHTAVPTITAIRAVGAIPVFVDIDPNTWVMDAEKALNRIGKKTKAIIPVHLYGNAVDLEKLSPFKNLIIEDVAQAQGASYKNMPLGTWGRMGAFSFYPTKNLGALGDGGAIIAKSAEDQEKLRLLRFYGQKDRNFAIMDEGMNSRLDEIQAAFLRSRLKKYRQHLKTKFELREKYISLLAQAPVKFQEKTADCEPAWHLNVLEFRDEKTRDHVKQSLELGGVGSLIHYPYPNHVQPAYKQFSRESLPVTEALCKKILSIPLHPDLSHVEIENISAIILKATA